MKLDVQRLQLQPAADILLLNATAAVQERAISRNFQAMCLELRGFENGNRSLLHRGIRHVAVQQAGYPTPRAPHTSASLRWHGRRHAARTLALGNRV